MGGGSDQMLGSDTDDGVDGKINMGMGADFVDAGAGNDTYYLGVDLASSIPPGQGDGDVDTVKFSDGDGQDTIHEFEAPIENPDGTYTGVDQLNVSELTSDGGTTPVTTDDVVVTASAGGDAVLTFPGGESLTLIGLSVSDVQTTEQLAAMGIPLEQ